MAPKPHLIPKRASLSDAKLAYFEGDFERCLAVCAEMRVRTLATASEVALLCARAYLCIGQPGEAENAIRTTLETHATLDASLTAEMLVATARIRQDDPDTGIAMLVHAAARSADAHFAIRSEIAFCTALGYWAKRDIESAEGYLALVHPGSDIIHARALELRAWCYTAQRDYRRSAEFFRLTLMRLDDCQASDRAIAARAISTLSIYAAELFDCDIARFVETRVQAMDWSSGLLVHQHLTLLHQALYHEFAGNTVEAYQFATQAREAAPTVAFEVSSWAFCSGIARNAGEAYSAIVFGKRAQKLLATLDVRQLNGEERFSILSVAENCAHFDPANAAGLFASYWGLAPVDKMLSLSGDPRLTADETFIEGVIAHAQGERERAQACYRKAFSIFKEIGYVRRAMATAHALLKLVDDDDLRSFIWANAAGTANYITKSLSGPRLDGVSSLERHRVVASLPRTQKEVVILICQGKTNKEIAQLRNVREQTIKNMLTKNVFPAFGVSNRAALVSRCLRESFTNA